METRAGHIAVGAFVLVLAAGAILFVVWLARFQAQKDIAYYDIRFTGSVTGLAEGSPVRYRGIPVGRVVDIRIDPEDPALVRVTVEIDRGTPVRTDSFATLETQGITGVLYVQILGGSPNSQRLPETRERPFPVIASRASRLEELFESAPQLLARANQLVGRVEQLFSDENRAAISETLDNLRAITGTLAQDSGGLEQVLVNGAAAAEQIEAATAEFEHLARDVRGELESSKGEISRTLVEARRGAQAFGQVADQLQQILTENHNAVSDFMGYGLYEATQLMTELRLLVATLTRVSQQIERDPARFFFGNRAAGIETE